MKKETKLPKEIFVYWVGEPSDQYLAANKTPSGIDDGTQVGIYELVAVKKQKITEELV